MRRLLILFIISILCYPLAGQTLRSSVLLKNLNSLSNQDSLNLRPLTDKLKGASNYSIRLSYYKAGVNESINGFKRHKAEQQAINLIKAFFLAKGCDPQKIHISKAKKSDYATARQSGALLTGGIRIDIAITGYKEPPVKSK